MAAGMKDIRRRIRSVENTMQITKAMELVASSKLRRAKDRVEKARPFFDTLYKTMVEIAKVNREFTTTYTQEREVVKTGLIVISGDRGLAGGYNSNVLKFAMQQGSKDEAIIIPIGKKTGEFFAKRGYEVIKTDFPTVEEMGLEETYELADLVTRLFKSGKIDELRIVYTKFVSMLNQEPDSKKLLPLRFDDAELEAENLGNTDFEPSAEFIFATIVPQYIGGIIYGAVTESYASEQGARRTAMEAASDNAGAIIEDLNLKFNRARQAAITQEITEIVSGANALS